jgi:hypothetical protein
MSLHGDAPWVSLPAGPITVLPGRTGASDRLRLLARCGKEVPHYAANSALHRLASGMCW